MKKVVLTALLILINTTTIIAQQIVKDSLFKPNYPEGIYATKESFIAKTPTDIYDVVAKNLAIFSNKNLTDIVHNCFFYNADSDEKITDVFAISYKGHLYFTIVAILDYRNEKDRAQTSDYPNSFVRVIFGGNNYYYTEAQLANKWAQGVTAGVGGVVGYVVAGAMIYGKGVVWDFKNSEFNIFKNCEDYNTFIADKNAEGVQECKKHLPDMYKVRVAVDKIK